MRNTRNVDKLCVVLIRYCQCACAGFGYSNAGSLCPEWSRTAAADIAKQHLFVEIYARSSVYLSLSLSLSLSLYLCDGAIECGYWS